MDIIGGLTQTERGMINIEATYASGERAEIDGYRYAFTSEKLGCDVYSKCLDDKGLYHSFAVIGR